MFGTYGAVGGINFVHPWPHGEWRVLGVGLALNREFGQYLEFRNKLPDTSANLIDRNRTTLTICLSTDFVAKTRRGSSGYQFAHIFNPKTLPGFDASRYPKSYRSCIYNPYPAYKHKQGYWLFSAEYGQLLDRHATGC